MFDRFTDRARKVMGLARQEARRFNHQHIGTEHILLGLIQVGNGAAGNVLRVLDVTPAKIQAEVEKIVQDGPTMVTMGQLPFTPRAKSVLELSRDASDEFHHNYIGTEHLLLGLIQEKEGIGAKVLKNLGLNMQNVRDTILELPGAERSEPTPEHDEIESRAFFDAYQAFTRTTAIYPGAGSGDFEAMTYVALKMSGECGEFAEKLGKRIRKHNDIRAISRDQMDEETRLELAKELGDVLWYVAGAASELGFNLSYVARINIEKLTSRKTRGVIDGAGDNR